jgi:hypothetical protein
MSEELCHFVITVNVWRTIYLCNHREYLNKYITFWSSWISEELNHFFIIVKVWINITWRSWWKVYIAFSWENKSLPSLDLYLTHSNTASHQYADQKCYKTSCVGVFSIWMVKKGLGLNIHRDRPHCHRYQHSNRVNIKFWPNLSTLKMEIAHFSESRHPPVILHCVKTRTTTVQKHPAVKIRKYISHILVTCRL